MALSMKNIFTTGEVARLLSVAPRTVSKWFDSGKLKGYRLPGSQDRRIPREHLVTFLKEHGMPPVEEFEGTSQQAGFLPAQDGNCGCFGDVPPCGETVITPGDIVGQLLDVIDDPPRPPRPRLGFQL